MDPSNESDNKSVNNYHLELTNERKFSPKENQICSNMEEQDHSSFKLDINFSNITHSSSDVFGLNSSNTLNSTEISENNKIIDTNINFQSYETSGDNIMMLSDTSCSPRESHHSFESFSVSKLYKKYEIKSPELSSNSSESSRDSHLKISTFSVNELDSKNNFKNIVTKDENEENSVCSGEKILLDNPETYTKNYRKSLNNKETLNNIFQEKRTNLSSTIVEDVNSKDKLNNQGAKKDIDQGSINNLEQNSPQLFEENVQEEDLKIINNQEYKSKDFILQSFSSACLSSNSENFKRRKHEQAEKLLSENGKAVKINVSENKHHINASQNSSLDNELFLQLHKKGHSSSSKDHHIVSKQSNVSLDETESSVSKVNKKLCKDSVHSFIENDESIYTIAENISIETEDHDSSDNDNSSDKDNDIGLTYESDHDMESVTLMDIGESFSVHSQDEIENKPVKEERNNKYFTESNLSEKYRDNVILTPYKYDNYTSSDSQNREIISKNLDVSHKESRKDLAKFEGNKNQSLNSNKIHDCNLSTQVKTNIKNDLPLLDKEALNQNSNIKHESSFIVKATEEYNQDNIKNALSNESDITNFKSGLFLHSSTASYPVSQLSKDQKLVEETLKDRNFVLLRSDTNETCNHKDIIQTNNKKLENELISSFPLEKSKYSKIINLNSSKERENSNTVYEPMTGSNPIQDSVHNEEPDSTINDETVCISSETLTTQDLVKEPKKVSNEILSAGEELNNVNSSNEFVVDKELSCNINNITHDEFQQISSSKKIPSILNMTKYSYYEKEESQISFKNILQIPSTACDKKLNTLSIDSEKLIGSTSESTEMQSSKLPVEVKGCLDDNENPSVHKLMEDKVHSMEALITPDSCREKVSIKNLVMMQGTKTSLNESLEGKELLSSESFSKKLPDMKEVKNKILSLNSEISNIIKASVNKEMESLDKNVENKNKEAFYVFDKTKDSDFDQTKNRFLLCDLSKISHEFKIPLIGKKGSAFTKVENESSSLKRSLECSGVKNNSSIMEERIQAIINSPEASLKQECIEDFNECINQSSGNAKATTEINQEKGLCIQMLSNQAIKMEMEPCTRKEEFDNSYEVNNQEESVSKDNFDWDHYLEKTNSEAVPPTAFLHVEHSLDTGVRTSQVLEVLSTVDDEKNINSSYNWVSYWPAKVVSSCGNLLRLKYITSSTPKYSNVSLNFWCDLSSPKIKPLGWSVKNGFPMCPPPEFNSEINCFSMEKEFMKTLDPVPEEALSCENRELYNQVSVGMLLEVLDSKNPYIVKIVKVLRNVGGRLLLTTNIEELGIFANEKPFWLFFLHERIRPLRWALKQGEPYRYETCEGSKLLEDCIKDVPEKATFLSPNSILLSKHNLEEGMYLEAFHPLTLQSIHVAVVSKVVSENYFEIEVDELSWVTSIDDPLIVPYGFAEENSLDLISPKNLKGEFPTLNGSCNAPKEVFSKHTPSSELGFEVGQKLEVAAPVGEGRICIATIERVVQHILLLRLDSNPKFGFYRSSDSMDNFPAGWAHSNSYPLAVPRSYILRSRNPSVTQNKENDTVEDDNLNTNAEKTPWVNCNSMWCPRLFINHCCYPGPFLSKTKVAKMSQSVGPGPLSLVLHDVISMTINAAYIPTRVLRELQNLRKMHSSWHSISLKAKFKRHILKAGVNIPSIGRDVPIFLNEFSRILMSCPNLWSYDIIGENCSWNCNKQNFSVITSGTSVFRGRGGIRGAAFRRKKGGKKRLFYPIKSPANNQEDNTEEFCDPDDGEEGEEVNSESEESRPSSPASLDVQRKLKPKRILSSLEITMNDSRVSDVIKERPTKRSRGEIDTESCSRQQVSSSLRFEEAATIIEPKKPRIEEEEIEEKETEPENAIYGLETAQVDSDPLSWSIEDVERYISSQPDISHHAVKLKEQEVDGRALLLLNLPSLIHHLGLPHSVAVTLAQYICKVKMAHFVHYYPKYAKNVI